MILKNVKALLHQVHLLYCIYEGREVTTYCVCWRLLTDTESIMAGFSGKGIVRVLSGNIIGRAEESNDKLNCQGHLSKKTTKLGFRGHCFSCYKLKVAFEWATTAKCWFESHCLCCDRKTTSAKSGNHSLSCCHRNKAASAMICIHNASFSHLASLPP